MPEIIKLIIDGQPVDALVGVPDAPGRHPGILIAHHQEGLSPFTRNLVDKLVANGYVAICPDHYHRCAPDADLETRRNSLRDSAILQELGTALDILKRHPKVDVERIGIVGHCMGGRAAFLATATFPGFAAAAIFYPTGMTMKRGDNPAMIERLHKVTCPTILFFGETDFLIPLDHADKIEAELRSHGVAVEAHRYADAGHAFGNFSTSDFRPGPAADAWRRAVNFLDQHLKPAAGRRPG